VADTRSNAVELLIAILALVKGDIDIVQASMVGSILSNRACPSVPIIAKHGRDGLCRKNVADLE
jgi:hypothetical protein